MKRMLKMLLLKNASDKQTYEFADTNASKRYRFKAAVTL
jgi:hypothetical protein